MSEALGRTGRAGTEELSGIVNGCFATLIGIAQAHGGDVAKFGGDAMTVLFVPDGSRRVIACALEMQAAMAAFRGVETRAGAYDLALKIGVAGGRLFVTTVGSQQTQLEFVIAGGALQAAATAQGYGAPGEVVLHESIASDVGPGSVEPRAAGYVVLKGALPLQPALGPVAVDESPGAWDGELALFLHPRIRERLAAGFREFVAEHRAVTVLFVGFDGFDYDGDRAVADALQRYFERVLSVLARYDASLLEIDVADKGSVFIVALGAPVAHEDDAERGLLCALELLGLAPEVTTIGVNTGLAFCGYVGSPVRRAYSVFGDTVNTAARVMAASRAGQVLAAAATQDRAGGRFAWGEALTVAAKGKADGIRVAPVLGASDVGRVPTRRAALVGRTDELAVARVAIDAALDGRGQVLAVSGEPGIGKSRLAAETARLARARGVTVFLGAAESFGARASHVVWRGIWRAFFGLERSRSPARAISRVEHRLAEVDPRLAARAPLLGRVVGLSIPDNEMTAGLGPELRLASLHSMLLECLLDRASRTPLLLVLEDCHWIDELSQELLELIARNVSRAAVLMLVLHRSDAHPLARLEGFAHVRTVRLARLADQEAHQLIRARAGGADVPERVVDAIAAKASGNPFYIEELLNFVRDRGVGFDGGALELPATLNNVVLARVDRLSERAGSSLRVASAIGRAFPARWIWGSYPEVGRPPEIRTDLDTTTRLDLTELDRPPAQSHLRLPARGGARRRVWQPRVRDALIPPRTGRVLRRAAPRRRSGAGSRRAGAPLRPRDRSGETSQVSARRRRRREGPLRERGGDLVLRAARPAGRGRGAERRPAAAGRGRADRRALERRDHALPRCDRARRGGRRRPRARARRVLPRRPPLVDRGRP